MVAKLLKGVKMNGDWKPRIRYPSEKTFTEVMSKIYDAEDALFAKKDEVEALKKQYEIAKQQKLNLTGKLERAHGLLQQFREPRTHLKFKE